ncbi:MAG: FHA domain-containing protein, partial [Candidatus Eremiobacteraeota bacterium]|nr:FHA domain-containing protein [Candidatus Eremiobacteraeota bacterium]
LLNDDALPSEQGMLVWQGREGTYGLLQSDSSRVPMAVRRVVSGSPREIPVDRQRPTLLQEGDVILAGRSALVVRRAVRPAQPDRIAMADTRPGLMTPRSGQEEWQPAQSPFRSQPSPPQPAPEPTPTPVRSYQPAPIQTDPAASDDTVGHTVPTDEASPVWARRTQLPGNDTLSGRETLGNRSQVAAQNPAAPARRPPASAEPAPSPLSWPWKRTYDYVFDFLAGPNQGCQIALSEGDLPEGRTISIGATGERTNDIIIDSFGVSNRQAMLRYREKRFSLLNEGQSGSVTVNQVPLKSNDHVVLMTGDRIELGDSIFCFLERHTVDVLGQFRLAVESGVANDQDKAFVFSKQRIVVGRGKACEVRLSDLEVSRTHVSIVFRDEQFFIQHRSETNPTFLNGVSLLPGAERKLSPGDRIRLSSLTVLRFVRVDNSQRRKVVQF